MSSPFLLICVLDKNCKLPDIYPGPKTKCIDCGKVVALSVTAETKMQKNFPTVVVCIECGIKRAAQGKVESDLSYAKHH